MELLFKTIEFEQRVLHESCNYSFLECAVSYYLMLLMSLGIEKTACV